MLQTNEMVRRAIEILYSDTCDVYEYQKYTKPNKSTGHREVLVMPNLRCRVSFSSTTSTSNDMGASSVTQTVKLFVAPDVDIKAGSKISIVRHGTRTDYKHSGKVAMYQSHQEIVLDLFDGWA